mmetsp:Transcript_73509/g.191862  ORF Transcript_73509/g.191862 Transcript_73509/m.191862 type:complete len:310 (-) Transcript_73509:641-1570(-)
MAPPRLRLAPAEGPRWRRDRHFFLAPCFSLLFSLPLSMLSSLTLSPPRSRAFPPSFALPSFSFSFRLSFSFSLLSSLPSFFLSFLSLSFSLSLSLPSFSRPFSLSLPSSLSFPLSFRRSFSLSFSLVFSLSLARLLPLGSASLSPCFSFFLPLGERLGLFRLRFDFPVEPPLELPLFDELAWAFLLGLLFGLLLRQALALLPALFAPRLLLASSLCLVLAAPLAALPERLLLRLFCLPLPPGPWPRPARPPTLGLLRARATASSSRRAFASWLARSACIIFRAVASSMRPPLLPPVPSSMNLLSRSASV